MRALEDLVNDVRDRESRRYLEDATRAYQVGAFRAAIVATWVAVAFDLIGKIRQLAATGDAAASDFTRKLDQAIDHNSTSKLLEIERGLLHAAQETFEFIEFREFKELERLREDRHVCAHPAFVRPSEVFEPPPELVRAHIATAVDAVLSKGPTPGKRAIERFMAEIKRDSFPYSLDDLTPYLRDRYFEPGKSSLRRGLAALIVKNCLDGEQGGIDSRSALRYTLAARALERIEPGLLADALSSVVTRREQGPGLDDDELLRFTANLGDMVLAWEALPESSHTRVYEVLKSVNLQKLVDHGIFTRRLTIEAKEAVDARLYELDGRQLAEVIRQAHDLRFVQAAIDTLRESPTYEDADRNMEALILPLAVVMTAEHVRAVLSCLQDNPQARMASQMPPLFSEFFDRTQLTFADCYQDWFDLVEWLADTAPHRDATSYYAYPELRTRVHNG